MFSKQGLIFAPPPGHPWMRSHAQVPTVLVLPDRLRVYFAARPRPDLSLPSFVDLDRDDPSRVLALHDRPILEPGAAGTFDADGVMPSAVMEVGDEVWLYYSGWCRLGGAAPYNNATGLAVSRDGGVTFTRMFEGPILDRTAFEPWSATSPYVLRRGDDDWHMWYSSGTGWVEGGAGKLEHVYVLMHARSRDGLTWERDGRAVLPPLCAGEAQTRPTVVYAGGRFHMWFSWRGSRAFRGGSDSYRMGYAHSGDLSDWTRDDRRAGIDVSPEGWDSTMICYPCAVGGPSGLLLFYNGNGFGQAGFGLAVQDGG